MKIQSIEKKINISQLKKTMSKRNNIAVNKVTVVRIDTNDLYDEICNSYDNSSLSNLNVCQATEFETSMSYDGGKKLHVVVSNTLDINFEFGYIRIKPNEKNGVELCSMVVYDEFRGQGKGSILLNLFRALLFDAILVLVNDNVDFGDITLTAAAHVDSYNRLGQSQRFSSPMRQKLQMYTKLGFSVSKVHNAGLIDMNLNVEKFLNDCMSIQK